MYPVAAVSRRLTALSPGSRKLRVRSVHDMDALVQYWTGGLVMGAAGLYPVVVKHPLSWIASMLNTTTGQWSLGFEFNFSPLAADPGVPLDQNPAASAGVYGARHEWQPAELARVSAAPSPPRRPPVDAPGSCGYTSILDGEPWRGKTLIASAW